MIFLPLQINKLQIMDFPQEDKALVETIEVLAEIIDATNNWTSKSWFGKNLGWSKDAYTTTAHK